MPGTIWTIGHSNRSLEDFLHLLRAYGIEALADVRRFPGSRRHPQFGSEAFEPALRAAGVGYRHFAGLGGRRGRPRAGSPNTGWRVESFNAFADHMATDEFRADLAELIALGARQRAAIMCSEALPWRCHRRLIADALLVEGWTVLDIYSAKKVEPHTLTPFARLEKGGIIYGG